MIEPPDIVIDPQPAVKRPEAQDVRDRFGRRLPPMPKLKR